VPQLRAQQEPLVRPDRPGQCLDEALVLVAQAALGELGERLGIGRPFA